MIRVRSGWLILFVFAVAGAVTAQASDTQLASAESSWKTYADAMTWLRGTYRRTTFRETGGEMKKVGDNELEVKRIAGCDLLRVKLTTAPETVYATNHKYAFEISRNEGNDGWFIKRVDTALKRPFIGRGLPLGRECDEVALLPVSVADFRLSDLVKQPGFHASEIAEHVYRGDPCLRVVFRNPKPPGATDDHYFPESGTLVLDPKRSYIVREANATCRPENNAIVKLESTFEYDDASGQPLLKKFEQTTRYSGKSGNLIFVRKDVVECALSASSKLDEPEFSLKHYGLPEPEGFEVASNRSWQWILVVVGVLAAVLAGVLWRLAGRRQLRRTSA